MQLQNGLMAIALAAGLGLGPMIASAETVNGAPEPAPAVAPQPGTTVAGVVVPAYPYHPVPAPDIIVKRGATDLPQVEHGRASALRGPATFTPTTTPGYTGERNVRP